MSILGDSFKQMALDEEQQRLWEGVGRVIDSAIGPFKPGPLTMEIAPSETLGSNIITLRLIAKRLPNYPFSFALSMTAIDKAYFPEEYVFQAIRQPLFDHFRYRPSLPVDDHIILGEE